MNRVKILLLLLAGFFVISFADDKENNTIGMDNFSLYPKKFTATVSDELAIKYNPSLLAFDPNLGLMFNSYTYFDDDKFYENDNNYSVGLRLGGLGFLYEKYDEKEMYKVASALSFSDYFYFGSAVRWNSDIDTESDLSLTFRPYKFLSTSVVMENIFENNGGDVKSTFGLGYRPFEEYFTLSGDVSVYGDDFESIYYGVGLDAKVVDGINLFFSYHDVYHEDGGDTDPVIGGGVNFNLGFADIGSSAYSADDFEKGGVISHVAIRSSKAPTIFGIPTKKIIKLELSGNYTEEPEGFWIFKNKNTLSRLINKIEELTEDDDVSGIFLIDKGYSMSFAAREELRDAFEKFKAKGKKIVTYFNSSSQSSYYISSVADKVYMYPKGSVELPGLAIEMTFFKNLLSNLGVEMQVIKHGDYKSAGEMFSETKMSDANREQLEALLKTLDTEFKSEIAKSRGISVEKLSEMMNTDPYFGGKDALDRGIVDGLVYHSDTDSLVKEFIDSEADIVSAGNYFMLDDKKLVWDAMIENRIAVVYATGGINMGKSSSGGLFGSNTMGSETTANMIRAARTDCNVKAIVIRVDSPGGSALASDIILREIELAMSENEKPVVISMGGVAASGGYYISCKADKIFADKTTLTGSIGVIGMVPNLDSLYNYVGVTHDKISMNKYAGGRGYFNMHKLSDDEKELYRNEIAQIYDDFTTHVSVGRNMSKEKVDELGRGRVWSGSDALEIGLIDEIGGLTEAVEEAKKLAGLENQPEKYIKYKIITKGSDFVISDVVDNAVYSVLPESLRENIKTTTDVFKYIDTEEKVQLLMPEKIEVK